MGLQREGMGNCRTEAESGGREAQQEALTQASTSEVTGLELGRGWCGPGVQGNREKEDVGLNWGGWGGAEMKGRQILTLKPKHLTPDGDFVFFSFVVPH